jgi:methyl-accepting chemotaxis protein
MTNDKLKFGGIIMKNHLHPIFWKVKDTLSRLRKSSGKGTKKVEERNNKVKVKNHKLNLNSFKPGSLKNSILGKLSVSFISIIVIALLLVGVITSLKVSSGAKDTFISSTNEILVQNKNYVDLIVNNVDNYCLQVFADEELRKALTNEYTGNYEKFTAESNASKEILNLVMTNSTIDNMYIVVPDGISAGTSGFSAAALKSLNIKEEEFYKKAIEANGSEVWLPPHQDKLISNNTSKVISEVRSLKDVYTSKNVGVIKVNVKPKLFQDALAKIKIGQNGYMFIVDKDGYIISHPDEKMIGENKKGTEVIDKALSQESSGTFNYKDSNTDMFAVYTSSDKTGWRYVAVVPNKELTGSARSIVSIITVMSLVCLILTVIGTIFISYLISHPIKKIAQAMYRMENGDLTVMVDYNSKDELGQLGDNFNKMAQNLRDLVASVKDTVYSTNEASVIISESTGQLAVSTSDVSRVVEEIALGAGNQADQASKCVDTVESLGREIVSVVTYSGYVSSASNDTNDKAGEGEKTVITLKEKFHESARVIGEISESISELSENTKEIEEILDSINKISQQTNLLALNAAIEAARAGEAGRGFAVVAGEVRKLAEESKSAADRIGRIIKNVNSRTRDSVNTAKSIIDTLENQTVYVDSTLNVFRDIKDSIETAVQKINELNAAISNVDNGKNLIINSVEQIAAISQETAASTEEVSSSAEQQAASVQEMNSLAGELNNTTLKLKELVDKFII